MWPPWELQLSYIHFCIVMYQFFIYHPPWREVETWTESWSLGWLMSDQQYWVCKWTYLRKMAKSQSCISREKHFWMCFKCHHVGDWARNYTCCNVIQILGGNCSWDTTWFYLNHLSEHSNWVTSVWWIGLLWLNWAWNNLNWSLKRQNPEPSCCGCLNSVLYPQPKKKGGGKYRF